MEKNYYKCDTCLLYTSDAADERSSVDLGGRRIIKKKKTEEIEREQMINREKNKTESERDRLRNTTKRIHRDTDKKNINERET